MKSMRDYMRLVEGEVRPAPRLWIGPKTDVLNLDDLGVSHSRAVMDDPLRFGIDPALMRQIETYWDENELEFDFDLVIALAERGGWVRTSSDSTSNIAVSASTSKGARMALHYLLENGWWGNSVTIEIETIRGRTLLRKGFTLSDAELNSFVAYNGILRGGSTYETLLDIPESVPSF